MEKTFDILMEQTDDCLREYSKKQNWTPNDLCSIKDAVSIYDKLQRIASNCDALDSTERETYRSYGMIHTMPHYAHGYSDRAPRYYDYDGHLTSYGDRESMRRRRSYGEPRSTHSIHDRMIANLEGMMDDAKTEYEREQIMEFINLAKSRERQ